MHVRFKKKLNKRLGNCIYFTLPIFNVFRKNYIKNINMEICVYVTPGLFDTFEFYSDRGKS